MRWRYTYFEETDLDSFHHELELHGSLEWELVTVTETQVLSLGEEPSSIYTAFMKQPAED